MIEIVRHTQRNVKRWQDGDTRKRWTAAGMLVAEAQFRRIVGYSDLAKLVEAIERHHLTADDRHRTRRHARYRLTVTNTGWNRHQVPRRSGQPRLNGLRR